MELGNNRVWDYAADNYVHRLIQNKADGKLVQMNDTASDLNSDEKVDSITLEYNYLLTTQLESQRAYFEERLAKIENKTNDRINDLEVKVITNDELNKTLQDNIQDLKKEKVNLEKKLTNLNAKYSKLNAELVEEKSMNKYLTSNQELYQSKMKLLEEQLKKAKVEKETETAELQSQLNDLMFYLDAQSKISNMKDISKDELQESSIHIDTSSQASTSSNKSASAKLADRRKRK
jgi:BRCA1-associated protein